MRGTLLTLPPTFWFIPRFSICVDHPYSNPFTSIRVPVVLTSTKLCQFWSSFKSTNVPTLLTHMSASPYFDISQITTIPPLLTPDQQSICRSIPNHQHITFSQITTPSVPFLINPKSADVNPILIHTESLVRQLSSDQSKRHSSDPSQHNSTSNILTSVQMSQIWSIQMINVSTLVKSVQKSRFWSITRYKFIIYPHISPNIPILIHPDY